MNFTYEEKLAVACTCRQLMICDGEINTIEQLVLIGILNKDLWLLDTNKANVVDDIYEEIEEIGYDGLLDTIELMDDNKKYDAWKLFLKIVLADSDEANEEEKELLSDLAIRVDFK